MSAAGLVQIQIVDIGLFPLVVPEPFVAIVAGELGPASDGVPLDAVRGWTRAGRGKCRHRVIVHVQVVDVQVVVVIRTRKGHGLVGVLVCEPRRGSACRTGRTRRGGSRNTRGSRQGRPA